MMCNEGFESVLILNAICPALSAASLAQFKTHQTLVKEYLLIPIIVILLKL